MHCPLCKSNEMTSLELEPDLHAFRCDLCDGVWIPGARYSAWLDKHPFDVPETTPPSEVEVKEIADAKLCPECGHLMLKFRAGHGLNFFIDHCNVCGGFWLDPNEWDALKRHGLHDNLHQVPSAQWQKDLRQAAVREHIDAWRSGQLGPEVYARVKEFRDWLRLQPGKELILTILTESEDE